MSYPVSPVVSVSSPARLAYRHNPYCEDPAASPVVYLSAPAMSPAVSNGSFMSNSSAAGCQLVASVSVSSGVQTPVDSPPPSPTMYAAVPVGYEVKVEFKHGRSGVYQHTERVEPDTHLIVEGDRGTDLGMVVGVVPMYQQAMDQKKVNKVKRLATKEEVKTWKALVQDEARAMKYIKHQVSRHGISITVHRAEFQFDRKKLTFHYTTEAAHPDFRCLLKEGYRQFRCRIWMNNCNPQGTDPGQALPIVV
eukprot:TRINITY_DN3127_c1_g1_i1.p1 TRINITY_DN3127_c1_g1~~TRINITY_DN3127_c1_g1_i1.p1  ORF type:complete len:250 (+),score=69.42 TRINITY_DN3127_c1_g1_i1:52-801(+)